MWISLLAALVGLEGLGLLAGAGFFLTQIFVQSSTSLSGAIVIFIITLLVALGVLATAIATLRATSWVRGAILTWQILQIAVAISFIQGTDFWAVIGWVLVALSVASTALLLSKPVVASMTARS